MVIEFTEALPFEDCVVCSEVMALEFDALLILLLIYFVEDEIIVEIFLIDGLEIKIIFLLGEIEFGNVGGSEGLGLG